MKDFTNEERKELMEEFFHALDLLSRMPEMDLSIELRKLTPEQTICTICAWDERSQRGRAQMIGLDAAKARIAKQHMT